MDELNFVLMCGCDVRLQNVTRALRFAAEESLNTEHAHVSVQSVRPKEKTCFADSISPSLS